MLQTASLPNRIKEFYERVSVERDAALAELPNLYDERVHFINPVVDQQGIVAFREAWDTALRKYKVFKFHDIEVIGNDDLFSLTYSMTISFGLRQSIMWTTWKPGVTFPGLPNRPMIVPSSSIL